jgi:hypothetical protein
MSGTVLDHWLVRDYLSELDAAMRGLPPAQAYELKADQAVGQITGRADTLKSNATKSLLLTGVVTLLLLALLLSTALARPLRRLRSGTFDAVTR